MKRLSYVIFFFIAHSALAQLASKEFHDRKGNKCEENSSYFYNVGHKNKDGFFVDTVKSFYSKSNTPRSLEVRDRFGVPITAINFYPNGKINNRTYCDRKRRKGIGVDTVDYSIVEYYDSTGRITVKNGQGYVSGRLDEWPQQGKVVNGHRDSVWTYFYDNGKVYSYESWDHGAFIDGISYDSEGREFYYKELSSIPLLIGGPAQLSTRMNGNINYPKRAQQKSIEGKVFIEFMIEKDGTVSSPRVMKGIGFGCDEEALKVMQASPRWVPAKIKGQPIRYKMTLPILFKLS